MFLNVRLFVKQEIEEPETLQSLSLLETSPLGFSALERWLSSAKISSTPKELCFYTVFQPQPGEEGRGFKRELIEGRALRCSNPDPGFFCRKQAHTQPGRKQELQEKCWSPGLQDRRASDSNPGSLRSLRAGAFPFEWPLA